MGEKNNTTKLNEELIDAVEVQTQASVLDVKDQESTPGDSDEQAIHKAVVAQTHHERRNQKKHFPWSGKALHTKHKWGKWLALSGAAVIGLIIITTMLATLPYGHKTLPNIVVAGTNSGGLNESQLKSQLTKQQKNLKITLKPDGKTLQPKLEEIGLKVDVNSTVQNALHAKRDDGVFAKFLFWQKKSIPAVIKVDSHRLDAYMQAHVPEIIKAPQDAQLQFDADQSVFVISKQGDGQGPNVARIKQGLLGVGTALGPHTISVGIVKTQPNITEAKLKSLVEPANEFISHNVVLSGGGYQFTATKADIAAWLVPTPKPDGSIKLVVDPGKVQTYVQTIGQKISSTPQDEKVVTDDSGATTVLEQGRNGTQLQDINGLVSSIANDLVAGKDVNQTMQVEVAAYKTVNMSSYDKWIEVDLGQQRLIAYEKSKPVMNVLIASGVNKYPTVTGEYSIYLKVRSQTMTGGSRADGSFYNLPNVEWVNYFYQDYAIHGAYWRKVFGVPGSHGCVNMTNADAEFIYNWAPLGTKVIVHS